MAKLVSFKSHFFRGRRMVWAVMAVLGALALAGCHESGFHSIDITGASPPLAFTMTRANDGRQVSEADYRGKITLLYFGYTFCPDICPTTLANIADVLRKLGPEAKQVRVLFVTVDPDRDTLPVLANYVQSFGPEFDALRGTPDELAALARRSRVVYSVEPATKNKPTEVTHSPVVYVFDGSGTARLLISSLDDAKPDVDGVTSDLKRLIEEAHPTSWLTQLERLV
jgi:protein SCO1/2